MCIIFRKILFHSSSLKYNQKLFQIEYKVFIYLSKLKNHIYMKYFFYNKLNLYCLTIFLLKICVIAKLCCNDVLFNDVLCLMMYLKYLYPIHLLLKKFHN